MIVLLLFFSTVIRCGVYVVLMVGHFSQSQYIQCMPRRRRSVGDALPRPPEQGGPHRSQEDFAIPVARPRQEGFSKNFQNQYQYHSGNPANTGMMKARHHSVQVDAFVFDERLILRSLPG